MLLSCGDALIDFLPSKTSDGREALTPVVGGSCLNVAIGVARLDVAAGFVGGISTDTFGKMIADHALSSAVDLRYATRSDHQATLAVARAMDRNHAALHGLRRVVIDQSHRLPHHHDLFKMKQGPVTIHGLRSGAGGETFTRVGFPVNRKRDGQSHP